MHYENFSRHLREKYSTCLHVADRLVDRLEHKRSSRVLSTSARQLNNHNMIKAQQEISLPLISYLNNLECNQSKPIESNKEFEPYFNECILAAERIKNHRSSERDRQICYENVILTQKLERIKKSSRQKDHCQLLLSKVDYGHDPIQSSNQKSSVEQSRSSNEKIVDSSEEGFSGTILTDHSLSSNASENGRTLSENEDDQATAADVDGSIESCDSPSSLPPKQRNPSRKNCCFTRTRFKSINCKEDDSPRNQKERYFRTENERVYQHLSNIDMTMVRDSMPLSRLQTSKHFSICILPRFDSYAMKSMNNRSNVVSHERKYAFKQEILDH